MLKSSLTQIEKYSERGQILKDPPGTRNFTRKQKNSNNSVYVLFFFSQTVGVRSQKTRWLYVARRGDFRGTVFLNNIS